MISVKITLKPLADDNANGMIIYQLTSGSKKLSVKTDYVIKIQQYDSRRHNIRNFDADGHLLPAYRRVADDIAMITRIADELEHAGIQYTLSDIATRFHRQCVELGFDRFMLSLSARIKANGQIRTSETYNSARKSFSSFMLAAYHEGILDRKSMRIDNITDHIIESYQKWLLSKDLSKNTVSFYQRILRAAYNRAAEQGFMPDRRPFRHVYTGICKTSKRALTLDTLRTIKNLNLAPYPKADYARDMFMLSFYLRGMSFVDMAYLRKSNLKNGYISYRRRKTGQALMIKWTKEMQTILDKYPCNRSGYLLPIILSDTIDSRRAYLNAGFRINSNLKIVAVKTGLTVPLTMYVARHSWASAAKSKGVPIGVISEGMGHGSETTTRIYLASLDTSVVDRANSRIIASL